MKPGKDFNFIANNYCSHVPYLPKKLLFICKPTLPQFYIGYINFVSDSLLNSTQYKLFGHMPFLRHLNLIVQTL